MPKPTIKTRPEVTSYVTVKDRDTKKSQHITAHNLNASQVLKALRLGIEALNAADAPAAKAGA